MRAFSFVSVCLDFGLETNNTHTQTKNFGTLTNKKLRNSYSTTLRPWSALEFSLCRSLWHVWVGPLELRAWFSGEMRDREASISTFCRCFCVRLFFSSHSSQLGKKKQNQNRAQLGNLFWYLCSPRRAPRAACPSERLAHG